MARIDRRGLIGVTSALVAAGIALPAISQEPTLAERRALAQFQERRLAALTGEIHAAAGFAVPLDIKWEELAVRGESQWYNDDDYWVVIFFRPLAEALKSVAADQMGRDALKSKLKRIVLRYDQATAPASNYPNGVAFADGVLTINFRPRANIHDVAPRAKAIKDKLEAGL